MTSSFIDGRGGTGGAVGPALTMEMIVTQPRVEGCELGRAGSGARETTRGGDADAGERRYKIP